MIDAADLVVISNAEQFDDGQRLHLRCGFETQIEDLGRYFRHTYFYSPAVDYPFDGYSFGEGITSRPLCQGLHRSNAELMLKLPSYTMGITRAIRRHRGNTLFLAYLPDSYIGLLALALFRLFRVRAFYRVTNDLVAEFVSRKPSRTRKAVASTLGRTFNFVTTSLLTGRVAFFTGELFLGHRPGFYAIDTCSLRLTDVYLREPKRQGPYNVYFVGRFDQNKGLRFFLEAATRAPSDVHYHIVGYGTAAQEASLMKLLIAFGLGDRVRLHGYAPFGPKLFEHLRMADLLVVPSIAEYGGKTHIEGMAFGCCVIASDVGGITKALHHLENGYLVEPGSGRAIAEAVERLLRDLTLRRRLMEGGYQTAPRFTVESMNEFIIEKLVAHGLLEESFDKDSLSAPEDRMLGRSNRPRD